MEGIRRLKVWLILAAIASIPAGCASYGTSSSSSSKRAAGGYLLLGTSTTPEDPFCDTHACIDNFSDGTGAIVQCNDGMWSHSGGLPGACSHHEGVRHPGGSSIGTPALPKQVPVPNVVGKTEVDAKNALGSAGFTNLTTSTLPTSQTPGTVITEIPPPGFQVTTPGTTTVNLTIAEGVTVPSVVGQSLDVARITVSPTGLNVSVRTQTVSDQSKDNIVLSQSPSAGTTVTGGSTMMLTVGQFNPTTTGR